MVGGDGGSGESLEVEAGEVIGDPFWGPEEYPGLGPSQAVATRSGGRSESSPECPARLDGMFVWPGWLPGLGGVPWAWPAPGAGEGCPGGPPAGLFPSHQSCGCWQVASRPWRAWRVPACASSPWHRAPARASPGNRVDSAGSALSGPLAAVVGSPPWPAQPAAAARGPAPRFLITHARAGAGCWARCPAGGRGGHRGAFGRVIQQTVSGQGPPALPFDFGGLWAVERLLGVPHVHGGWVPQCL